MGKRKLRGTTEEEWQKKWEEFWADMEGIPKALWEFIPEKLTAGGDPDTDLDEIREQFAGEPTMLPEDALLMLDRHQRLILALPNRTLLPNGMEPCPTKGVIELMGRRLLHFVISLTTFLGGVAAVAVSRQTVGSRLPTHSAHHGFRPAPIQTEADEVIGCIWPLGLVIEEARREPSRSAARPKRNIFAFKRLPSKTSASK